MQGGGGGVPGAEVRDAAAGREGARAGWDEGGGRGGGGSGGGGGGGGGGGFLRVEKVTEGRVDYLRRAKGTETAPKNYGLEVDFSNTPTPKKAKNEDGHLRHRLNGHTSEDSEDLLIPRKKQISCWERIMKIMFDW